MGCPEARVGERIPAALLGVLALGLFWYLDRPRFAIFFLSWGLVPLIVTLVQRRRLVK